MTIPQKDLDYVTVNLSLLRLPTSPDMEDELPPKGPSSLSIPHSSSSAEIAIKRGNLNSSTGTRDFAECKKFEVADAQEMPWGNFLREIVEQSGPLPISRDLMEDDVSATPSSSNPSQSPFKVLDIFPLSGKQRADQEQADNEKDFIDRLEELPNLDGKVFDADPDLFKRMLKEVVGYSVPVQVKTGEYLLLEICRLSNRKKAFALAQKIAHSFPISRQVFLDGLEQAVTRGHPAIVRLILAELPGLTEEERSGALFDAIDRNLTGYDVDALAWLLDSGPVSESYYDELLNRISSVLNDDNDDEELQTTAIPYLIDLLLRKSSGKLSEKALEKALMATIRHDEPESAQILLEAVTYSRDSLGKALKYAVEQKSRCADILRRSLTP